MDKTTELSKVINPESNLSGTKKPIGAEDGCQQPKSFAGFCWFSCIKIFIN